MSVYTHRMPRRHTEIYCGGRNTIAHVHNSVYAVDNKLDHFCRVTATFVALQRVCSGVTRNSGTPGQISKSSIPPFPAPSPPSASFLPLTLLPHFHPFLPLPTPPYPFTPFPSLPFLFPNLFPLSPSPPLITARGSGERYSSPSGSGQRIFLCNSQPKIGKSVKSFTHVHATPIHSVI